MYRFLILLAAMFFSLASTSFADKQPEWVFVGYRIANYAGPPKTINKIPTEYGYIWLKRDSSYSKAKDEFKARIKAANKGAYVDFAFARQSSYNFVAIYQVHQLVGTWKGPELEVTQYNFYKGKTKEAIGEQASKDMAEYEYISAKPVQWLDLSAPRQEKVSEVLSLEAVGGAETQQSACNAAITAARQKADHECTVIKQGELVDLKPDTRQSVEFEIPAGQSKAVSHVENCSGCNQSQTDGWSCTGKVTIRCNHETVVEDTGLINKLRGKVQNQNNPCEEDAGSAACRDYEKEQQKKRSSGDRG